MGSIPVRLLKSLMNCIAPREPEGALRFWRPAPLAATRILVGLLLPELPSTLAPRQGDADVRIGC